MTAQAGAGLHHLEAFLEMLSAERGASVHTLDAYRRDLLDYAGFLRKRGRSLANGSAADIRAYLGALSAAGLKASTQARRWCAPSRRAVGRGARSRAPARSWGRSRRARSTSRRP